MLDRPQAPQAQAWPSVLQQVAAAAVLTPVAAAMVSRLAVGAAAWELAAAPGPARTTAADTAELGA